MELLGIGVNRDRRSSDTVSQIDYLLLLGVAFDQVQGAPQRVAQVVANQLHLRRPGEIEKPLNRALHADNLLQDHMDVFFA